MKNLAENPQRRVLPTLEADGSRRWLTPRLGRGRFLSARRGVAYLLIAIFTLVPFIQIGGKPAILLDVVHRRFTLLGYTFLPTDTLLLALLMVATILSIFFFTALAGRVWCGWMCPQTVYLEFLFRPIERLCMGRAGVGGKQTKPVASWRIGAMYLVFLLCALYLAHTFLSYFVGVHELRHWMLQSPAKHPASFVIVLFVTGAMLFNFCYFREQTCLIACPYGRFQSVLLDRDSLVIRYDEKRGEPRGKAAKTRAIGLPVVARDSTDGSTCGGGTPTPSPAKSAGDCVDCSMCVQVCPTGIDIRDGLQFECIACAQCIDACDAVMDKLGRSRGLIRYSSQSAMAGQSKRILRPRLFVYGLVVSGLITALTVLLVSKKPFDVHIARQGGLPFVLSAEGLVENVMRLNLTNRSDEEKQLTIAVVDSAGTRMAGSDTAVAVKVGEMVQQPIHLLAPRDAFQAGRHSVVVRVSDSKGTFVDRKCQLFGPGTAATLEHAQ